MFFTFRFKICFFLKCIIASNLTTFYYLNCFGLDSLYTDFQPASFDVKNLTILYQTMVYAATFSWGFVILCNVLQKRNLYRRRDASSPKLQTFLRSQFNTLS
jgi:hypothetical protein